MIDVAAGGASDVGRVRAVNQDSFSLGDRLWVVADGMGGHRGGEVASQITVDVLGENYDEFTTEKLVAVAQLANGTVYDRATEDTELRGMGTTLCALALVDTDDDTQGFAVINIGDSRCYQWRDDELRQITRDHSLVEDMRAAGQITDAEAAVHPHRNIVTRALGIQPVVEVDSFELIPATGDRYVLCSDGLFNEVSADRIGATLRRLADPRDAASELVRQANEAGGRDNITVVVVDVLDDDGAGATLGVADPGADRAPDMAGITTAHPAAVVREEPEPAEQPDAPKVRLRRASWRTLIFVVILLAILGVAVAAVGWYSRGSYYVGFDDSEVTIFKGRPEKVLWFSATVEQRTGIARRQVPATMLDAVTKGKEQPSRGAADAYVAQLRSVICSDLRNGAKPPAAVPGAPPTTIPTECADLAEEPHTTTTTTEPGASAPTTTSAPATTKPPATTVP